MFNRACVVTFGCLLLVFSFSGHGRDKAPSGKEQKRGAEDPSEMTVRFRLNGIEAATYYEEYRQAVKRERGLQENVRACIQSGDNRLPEYKQALQNTQDDLAKLKKKLAALESEKTKLVRALGKKRADELSLEAKDRTLDKILERLTAIDKRLEKIERRR
jgi:chromosome segregation ATPase